MCMELHDGQSLLLEGDWASALPVRHYGIMGKQISP
jgi:hypothetical protein